MIWDELKLRLHANDQAHPESWQRCYDTKYGIARMLQPTSILEFGVRTGYSAFAFLSACPHARYVGVDNNSDSHGGFSGAIGHAKSLLSSFRAQIIQSSSDEFIRDYLSGVLLDSGIQETPAEWNRRFDMIHVDGDHSFEGCLSDLKGADRMHPRAIVVDDTDAIPEVRAASRTFAMEHKQQYVLIRIQDNHHGVQILVRR